MAAHPGLVLLESEKGRKASSPFLLLHKAETLAVVFRPQSSQTSKVTLLSGGGSGHEPAHAGYVGEGMLDAAVCGDIFASPSGLQISAGLTAIESEKGFGPKHSDYRRTC